MRRAHVRRGHMATRGGVSSLQRRSAGKQEGTRSHHSESPSMHASCRAVSIIAQKGRVRPVHPRDYPETQPRRLEVTRCADGQGVLQPPSFLRRGIHLREPRRGMSLLIWYGFLDSTADDVDASDSTAMRAFAALSAPRFASAAASVATATPATLALSSAASSFAASPVWKGRYADGIAACSSRSAPAPRPGHRSRCPPALRPGS